MNITTVIVNFNTPELLRIAVESFLDIYPDQKVLIFDNGSENDSIEVIESLKNENPDNVNVYFSKENIYHGPAMDKALRELVSSEKVFFLDSDTETKKRGFLEEMCEKMDSDETIYAMGQRITVNKRGFKDPGGSPVILTPYLLVRRDLYENFPPFIHHGQPTIHNFKAAHEKGYKLEDYPVYRFIDHEWRGTASKFGYKLGLKGKWDYFMNRLGL